MDQVRDNKNTDESWLENISIKEAMKKLTANQRLVIYLFYYEQIPIKNIAKIHKKSCTVR